MIPTKEQIAVALDTLNRGKSVMDVLNSTGTSNPFHLLRDFLEAARLCHEQAERIAELEKAAKAALDARREMLACDVCGNWPDEHGVIEHGKGCFIQSEDGGGTSFVDLKE